MDNGAVPFSVRIAVRNYELDTIGHVNQAVYHSYAEHSRVEFFRAAGCGSEVMFPQGFGPVVLSSEARYLRELRLGDEIDLTTVAEFGEGKTFALNTTLTKTDGTVSATINCTMGLIDLTARKLLADPRERFRALAKNPAMIFGE
jgi:acyl-CoA thioester hydrolase